MMARSTPSGDYAVSPSVWDWRSIYLRGLREASDPLQFADSIAGFRILPSALINPLALALPHSRSHAASCCLADRPDGSER